jgi:release factor glutamine methyltransferase
MFADNSIKAVQSYLQQKLEKIYSVREIQIFSEMILDALFDLSKTDLILNTRKFSESELLQIRAVSKRLVKKEPIQHILGVAHFYGYDFKVNKDVLIPRPETEELVALVLENHEGGKLLDIGTGSGCIPITLKKENDAFDVSAIDISEDALGIASINASDSGAEINFIQSDILKENLIDRYDIIISNPPYVLESDKKDMQESVLDFEPELALFVPDHKALMFYERIASLAINSLHDSGYLYFEIHESFGQETIQMLKEMGFQNINLYQDLQGKDRIVSAQK